MNNTATTGKFRYLGVTDESTECGQCGKTELRSTVVLAPLDADGNPGEPVYFGSTCAARALGVRGGGRAVLSSARAAHHQNLTEAAEARRKLAFYGLPETGPVSPAELAEAAAKFAEVHRNAMWAHTVTAAGWRDRVREMLTRRRAQLALAALVEPVCSYCHHTHK